MRTKLRSATFAVLVLIAPALMPQCGGSGVRLQGNTYVNAWCISWAGITWSASTSGFLKGTKIHYHARVRYNGQVVWQGWSGWYYTNSIGNHFQWPGNSGHEITCGSGVYSVEVYTANETNRHHTFTGWDEVACE